MGDRRVSPARAPSCTRPSAQVSKPCTCTGPASLSHQAVSFLSTYNSTVMISCSRASFSRGTSACFWQLPPSFGARAEYCVGFPHNKLVVTAFALLCSVSGKSMVVSLCQPLNWEDKAEPLVCPFCHLGGVWGAQAGCGCWTNEVSVLAGRWAGVYSADNAECEQEPDVHCTELQGLHPQMRPVSASQMARCLGTKLFRGRTDVGRALVFSAVWP